MARLTVTVRGLAEFERFARSLPGVAAPEILRPIILRGAERFEESIRAEARRDSDTGATAQTIEARLVKNTGIAAGYTTIDFARTREIRNIVRQSRGQAPVDNKARYPFIVATGAPPHVITARKGKGLLIGGRGENARVIRSVQHPGFTGSNFFANGVRAVRSAVRRQLEAEVKAEFLKHAQQFGVAAL